LSIRCGSVAASYTSLANFALGYGATVNARQRAHFPESERGPGGRRALSFGTRTKKWVKVDREGGDVEDGAQCGDGVDGVRC